MACVITMMPEELFKDLPDQAFLVATTDSSIYSNMQPSMRFDMSSVMSGDEWAKIAEVESPRGMGIAGMITEPYWFCQKMESYLDKLLK